MRVFAVVLAFSITLAAGVTYAQAPAPAPAAPATQKPRRARPGARPGDAEAGRPAPPRRSFRTASSTPTCTCTRRRRVERWQGRGREAEGAPGPEGPRAEGKNKALQAAQQKLESGGSVLSDAARAQLQAEIERQQRDIQRFTEDAQQDVQTLAQQVQEEFNRKLTPVVDKVAKEKQVHFVFNAAESGLVWADPGMDLTSDVIAAMNAGGAQTRLRPRRPRPAPPATAQVAREARVPCPSTSHRSSAASPTAFRRC